MLSNVDLIGWKKKKNSEDGQNFEIQLFSNVALLTINYVVYRFI